MKRNTYQLPYPLTNPAYPAMLAHDWGKKGQPDPTGYWASEKYDGVRALWDGETFYSRNGKVFHAPQWFKDTLPKTPLDGELWLERSVAGFQKGVGIVKRLKGGEAWRDITYIVFDIPTSTEPFEKVQEKLKRMNLGPYSHVAPQYQVKSESDMLRKYEEALAGGAEGIMLRAPGSRYVPKRTMALLKVKPTDSAEAVVIGYTAGKGRHLGRMGALRVHLLGDKSKQFKIGGGFEDAERDERLYPLGTIVEVNFNDKTAAGLPRFPRFHRVRSDLMASRPKRKAASKYKIVGQPFAMVHDRGRGVVDTRVAVVVAAGKHNIAFYQSTGTGTPGVVESGEWVPFGGVIPGWIIKTKDAKIPPGKMKGISRWLASKRIGEPERRFNVHDWEKINAFLKARGALCKLDSAVFSCKLPPEREAAPKPRAKPKAKAYRALFSGSRHWSDEAPVRRVVQSLPANATVVHGGAKGLDSIAGRLASERGLKVEVHPADWGQGRGAGPARNQDMVDLGADAVYAFPVEGSKGTWDLVRRAEAAGLPVKVHEATPKPKAKAKPARRATPRTKPKPAPRAAPPKAAKRDYFSMGSADLVALGDAGAKAELKRRGRDPATGKKRR